MKLFAAWIWAGTVLMLSAGVAHAEGGHADDAAALQIFELPGKYPLYDNTGHSHSHGIDWPYPSALSFVVRASNRLARYTVGFGHAGDITRLAVMADSSQLELPEIKVRLMANVSDEAGRQTIALDDHWATQRVCDVSGIVGMAQLAVLTGRYGKLYSFTHIPTGEAALVRHFAFVPAEGVDHKNWDFYLEVESDAWATACRHAWVGSGDQMQRVQVPGWIGDPQAAIAAGAPLRCHGWAVDPAAHHAAVWRGAMSITARSSWNRADSPFEIPETPLELEYIMALLAQGIR